MGAIAATCHGQLGWLSIGLAVQISNRPIRMVVLICEREQLAAHGAPVKKGPNGRLLLLNVLSAKLDPHQLLLVSGSTACKVTAVESLVEVSNSEQQWLVVENRSHLPAHVKKGDKVAYVSPLEETYEITEEMLREDNPEETPTLILNSLSNELDPLSLAEKECQEKLAVSLEYTNPKRRAQTMC